MTERRPPDIPIEREPTKGEFDRLLRRVLTYRPKRRPKAPKPSR